MKKNLLYLLALASIAFASCDPLDDTITELAPNSTYVKEMTLTMPTPYPTDVAASTAVLAELNSKYSHLSDGSTASVNVTYNYGLPAQVKPTDSAASNAAYTVTDADYLAINNNSFKNFAADKVLAFLATKFNASNSPANAPVEKQLQSLNYTYYESGVTPSAGIPAADSFLYLNGAWMKIYQVTAAQYASVGRGSYSNFSLADEPNLNKFFNAFLKADAAVSSTANVRDVKYVSFSFYNSISKVNSRRISTLVYNGGNWEYKIVPATAVLSFNKVNGTWKQILTVTTPYTLVAADYTTIASSTIGSDAARDNLKQHGNFDVSGGASTWKDDEIQAGIILVLKGKYPNAAADPNMLYKVTYSVYRGPAPTASKTFVKTADGFVLAK